MSSPSFFSDPARVDAMQREAETWQETPFRERGAVKGRFGGVDCAGLVLALYGAAGVPGLPSEVPEYDPDHGKHSTQSLLEDWVSLPENRSRLRRVDEDEPLQDGDLLFIKEAVSVHHIGVKIGPYCWHVIRPRGVTRTPLSNRILRPLIVSSYRLLS